MGCLSGECYDTEFNVFVMKDYDYNIMMMSTFSGWTVLEGHKEGIRMVNGGVSKFKYPAVVADYYRCRGAVGNHNSLRYDVGTKSQIGL